MFASAAFTSRPFSSGQIPARQTLLAATNGEYGWSAWTYSKTAKLNAWAWHGLGVTGTANINAWSQLGNSVYLRRDGDQSLYLMQPDVYFLASETNSESQAVYAETQWLDFGKPGDMKAWLDTFDACREAFGYDAQIDLVDQINEQAEDERAMAQAEKKAGRRRKKMDELVTMLN